jgi:type II secretory pathway predicted ATPase ExeA
MGCKGSQVQILSPRPYDEKNGTRLFLEQYKLHSNPFAPEAARSVFESHSMHYATFKLQELTKHQIQSLFLSGPAGVGKSTLVRQRLRLLRDATMSWLEPSIESRAELVAQLLEDIGPGMIDGTPDEHCKMLEVFLRHEAGNGRFSFVVANGLERFSSEVLRELEWLSQLRVRGRAVVHFALLTRNEELVANLLPQYQGGPLARAVHQRLTGFTTDETRGYVHACLRGAGCDWAEELIPDDVLVDIQAFTQGVVGDINALCRLALDGVAERMAGSLRQPRVTRVLLKEAGTQLNLRYDV